MSMVDSTRSRLVQNRSCQPPDRRSATPRLAPALAGVLPVLWMVAGMAQTPTLPVIDTTSALPIELDAEYSELDRQNDRLVFRRLQVTQGDLYVAADRAEAAPADFSNSTWVFTGNVVLRSGATSTECSTASLSFSNNRLLKAVLQGSPARFSQQRAGSDATTSGRGATLEYDVASGVIRISGDAWLSDGSNEISGADITYDLQRELVSAGAGDGSPVRMKIAPRTE